MIKFQAEVKQVKSKKLASLDIEYQLVVVTNDPEVMKLGLLPGDTLLNVEASINGE